MTSQDVVGLGTARSRERPGGRVGQARGFLRSAGGRVPSLGRLLAIGFGIVALTASSCPPDEPDEWDPWAGLNVDDLYIVPDPIWVRIADTPRQFRIRALPRAHCCGEIPEEKVIDAAIPVSWSYTSASGAILSVTPITGEPLSAVVTIANSGTLSSTVDFTVPSIVQVQVGTHPGVTAEIRIFDDKQEAVNDLVRTAPPAGTPEEPDAGLIAGESGAGCVIDRNVAFVEKAPLGNLLGNCSSGRPGRALLMSQRSRAGAGGVLWKPATGDEPTFAPATNTLEGSAAIPLTTLVVPVKAWSAVSTASPTTVSNTVDVELGYANYLYKTARAGVQFQRLPPPAGADIHTLTPAGTVDVAGSGGVGDCEHFASFPALSALDLANPSARVIHVVYVDGIFSNLDPAEPGPASGYAGFHCLKKAAWGSQVVFIDWSASGGSSMPTLTTLAHELAHALGLRDDEDRPGWTKSVAVGHTDHHWKHFDRTNLMYRHAFAPAIWHPYRYDLSLGQIARIHLDANGWLQLATSNGMSTGPLVRSGLFTVACQWQGTLDEPCPLIWDSLPGRP